jgi:hypothetical protein
MLALEQQAAARGCRYSVLNTFGFQAPEFYEKLGYRAFGVLDGLTDSDQWYFFRKALLQGEQKSHSA